MPKRTTAPGCPHNLGPWVTVLGAHPGRPDEAGAPGRHPELIQPWRPGGVGDSPRAQLHWRQALTHPSSPLSSLLLVLLPKATLPVTPLGAGEEGAWPGHHASHATRLGFRDAPAWPPEQAVPAGQCWEILSRPPAGEGPCGQSCPPPGTLPFRNRCGLAAVLGRPCQRKSVAQGGDGGTWAVKSMWILGPEGPV